MRKNGRTDRDKLKGAVADFLHDELERLKSIVDDEESPVEADSATAEVQQILSEATVQEGPRTRQAQVVDVLCPLCGHEQAKRYPRPGDNKWTYVCRGCHRSFDPVQWGIRISP
jgi:hypothetical protein